MPRASISDQTLTPEYLQMATITDPIDLRAITLNNGAQGSKDQLGFSGADYHTIEIEKSAFRSDGAYLTSAIIVARVTLYHYDRPPHTSVPGGTFPTNEPTASSAARFFVYRLTQTGPKQISVSSPDELLEAKEIKAVAVGQRQQDTVLYGTASADKTGGTAQADVVWVGPGTFGQEIPTSEGFPTVNGPCRFVEDSVFQGLYNAQTLIVCPGPDSAFGVGQLYPIEEFNALPIAHSLDGTIWKINYYEFSAKAPPHLFNADTNEDTGLLALRGTCYVKDGELRLRFKSGRVPDSGIDLDLETGVGRFSYQTHPVMPRFAGSVTDFSTKNHVLRVTAVPEDSDLRTVGPGPYDKTPLTLEGPCDGI